MRHLVGSFAFLGILLFRSCGQPKNCTCTTQDSQVITISNPINGECEDVPARYPQYRSCFESSYDLLGPGASFARIVRAGTAWAPLPERLVYRIR